MRNALSVSTASSSAPTPPGIWTRRAKGWSGTRSIARAAGSASRYARPTLSSTRTNWTSKAAWPVWTNPTRDQEEVFPMAKETVMAGCSAAAHAAKAARVEVISSYPIRPYTGIMMELSKLVAHGELDGEFVHAEGEHAQVSIAYGASACGARAYTGSAGVGVTYAMECYSPAAGGRYPIQMAIADRALDPPGDFGSEHTDVMSARARGWILGWAETPQEIFDNTIMYYRIGEDPKVMLPQFSAQDGYFVSHIPGKVSIPEQSQVDEYLPPYRPHLPLDPTKPSSHGPQIYPAQGSAIDIQRAIAMIEAPKV